MDLLGLAALSLDSVSFLVLDEVGPRIDWQLGGGSIGVHRPVSLRSGSVDGESLEGGVFLEDARE